MNANATLETLELNAEIAAEQVEASKLESLSIAEMDMIGGGNAIASYY